MAHAGGTPHRLADQMVGGLAGGAKGIVSTVKGGLQGVGNTVQGALDAPWRATVGVEQPLRIADRLLNGGMNAAENAVSQGVIGSFQMCGEAIQRALDYLPETLGIPPSMGDFGGGNFAPPDFLRGMPRMPFGR